MTRVLGVCALFALLYGCSSAGYLPYAPHALDPMTLRALVSDASHANGVPPGLIRAVVMAESAGNPSAISVAGAQGLMQLMPGTAADLGVANTFVPGDNISGGTAYLDSLLRRYRDNLALALAAYNAGPAAVDRWHGIPPYRETRAYVARVIHEFNRRVAARQTASAAH